MVNSAHVRRTQQIDNLQISVKPCQTDNKAMVISVDKDSKKIAEIYDMITIPPLSAAVTDSERSRLRKELTRFAEFSALALNAGAARSVILELQMKYDLMDI